jgi:hypothetical protein
LVVVLFLNSLFDPLILCNWMNLSISIGSDAL